METFSALLAFVKNDYRRMPLAKGLVIQSGDFCTYLTVLLTVTWDARIFMWRFCNSFSMLILLAALWLPSYINFVNSCKKNIISFVTVYLMQIWVRAQRLDDRCLLHVGKAQGGPGGGCVSSRQTSPRSTTPTGDITGKWLFFIPAGALSINTCLSNPSLDK